MSMFNSRRSLKWLTRMRLDGLGSIRTARYKGEYSSPEFFILLTTWLSCRLELTAMILGGLQPACQIRSMHTEPGVSAHHEGLGGRKGTAFAVALSST